MNYILRDLASTQKYKSIKEKLKNKTYPVEISGHLLALLHTMKCKQKNLKRT